MLSAYLVRTIENHAEDLTRELLKDLGSNPRTPSFHGLSRDELHNRVYDLYHNLGHWVGDRRDSAVEGVYSGWGRMRHAEGTPLSEVVYALCLIKEHLRTYIFRVGAVDSAVELYQEEELNLMIGHFFDKVLYYTVRGYEKAARPEPTVVLAER